MPYTLIKGSYHIHYPDTPLNGPEPDGDTLKFEPDSRQLIEKLPRQNRPARFNQRGITTIRFEGIDALETHYSVDGDEYHQEMHLALQSRDTLLEIAGFGDVSFFANAPFKVEQVENHPVRGYLLSNGLDAYGRTIAFCFIGAHSSMDGSQIFVQPEDLNDSLNAILLEKGQAYPAFYLSLPAQLRDHLRAISMAAREAKTGLWQEAAATTTQSTVIPGPEQLQDLVIWPKLFRRLASYFQDGHTDLSGFDAWLRADPRDRDDRILLPNFELGNMHDLINISGNNLKMPYMPADVVIVPDDYGLPDIPIVPLPNVHVGEGSVRIVAALINPEQVPELGNETVTILNATNHDINLDGWKLADRHSDEQLNGGIGPGNTQRIRVKGRVQLSNEMDTITLLNSDGNIIDQVSYESRDLPEEGFTMLF
jgi:endonuclease YncB( thermonuclease family)